MHAPNFWKEKSRISDALMPLASLYGAVARYRQKAIVPKHFAVPIICVGNAVAGGSGKTPVTLALAELLKAKGKHPHALSRGYKGSLAGPVQVDPAKHSAMEVGDEPLLLAGKLPTWVAKDRAKGAEAAIAAGADMILMDDGFQNPSIVKTVSLLVVDGTYGFGNERLLPAGPLREPVEEAMKRANAIVLIGPDRHEILSRVSQGKPVIRTEIRPLAQAYALEKIPVVAFAGIARPRKFYRTLQELGCDVRRMVAYPDHYAYRPKDLIFLSEKAKELEAKLVTTAKDYVRLPASMRQDVLTVPIEAVFEDNKAVLDIILAGG